MAVSCRSCVIVAGTVGAPCDKDANDVIGVPLIVQQSKRDVPGTRDDDGDDDVVVAVVVVMMLLLLFVLLLYACIDVGVVANTIDGGSFIEYDGICVHASGVGWIGIGAGAGRGV